MSDKRYILIKYLCILLSYTITTYIISAKPIGCSSHISMNTYFYVKYLIFVKIKYLFFTIKYIYFPTSQ